MKYMIAIVAGCLGCLFGAVVTYFIMEYHMISPRERQLARMLCMGGKLNKCLVASGRFPEYCPIDSSANEGQGNIKYVKIDDNLVHLICDERQHGQFMKSWFCLSVKGVKNTQREK